MQQLVRQCLIWCAVALSGAVAWAAPNFDTALNEGVALRRAGQTQQALTLLGTAAEIAQTLPQRSQAAAELGLALAQARRLDEARVQLTQAHEWTNGAQQAAYALELGHLAARSRDPAAAARWWQAAAAAGDPRVRLAARLNLAQGAGLDALAALAPAVRTLGDAGLLLNLGHQAQRLGDTTLAARSLDEARRSAAPGSCTHIEALDGLAQLYEAQHQPAEALRLNQAALDGLAGHPIAALGELPITLAWRAARLYKALNEPAAALAAYQHAADTLEALRADIPIELDDGSSSYASLFEPIYLGLIEGLLDASDSAPPAQAAELLRRARDANEILKQTELQDFLGDRCAVDAVKGGSATALPPGTAVLYAVLLPQRLELLAETARGLHRFTQAVSRESLRRQAEGFAKALRTRAAYTLALSQRLHKQLLQPIAALTREQGIHTLVVLPDGALRMVPFAALHDGERFAIETYAISSVAGLSMTNTSAPQGILARSLLAGVANFGPVVDKLLLTPSGQDLARQVGTDRSVRESLALPGVTREITALSQLLPGERLLDAGFTVEAFSRATRSGRYRVVHVASHGVFGGDARSSFMLAYDDLLTLPGLEQLLGAEALRRQGLELLTLSACETAEGNDRAPLGLSGAALRARAKSVLGTLWPVDDEAAVRVMERFYTVLADGRTSKAEALRRAQRELLAEPRFAHPFFWAPFTLIGNWL